MPDLDATIEEVARHIREAERVLFVTGAGLSADSGLPTYRGLGGLYDVEVTEEGVPIEVALSGPMFARRPDLTWKYLWQIGAACRGAVPNGCHEFIARVEREFPGSWVITQNVDGLHRAAGSKNVVAVHGDADRLNCTACNWTSTASDAVGDYEQIPAASPPRCPDCGAVIRPHVVLFEEPLAQSTVEVLEELSLLRFDVAVAVGTSALLPYVVRPITSAGASGFPTVEINPESTDLSPLIRYRIELGAADAAGRLSSQLWPDDT